MESTYGKMVERILKYVHVKKNSIQEKLEKVIRTGMTDKTLLTITYQSGFEKFGTFENWGQVWIVSGPGVKEEVITVSDSNIDVAVNKWITKYEKT